MKRDVDLIRQLLFDIERQGAECQLDALRNGAVQEIDDRVRYHVRLLIDAGLAKEIDRTTTGQPCVRLTNAGHEFLDLCRDESRWREAKWFVQEQSGGCSLTVLRAVLTKWAVDNISRTERGRRWRRTTRPQYDRVYYRDEPVYRQPVYRVESYRYEREPMFDDEQARFVRPPRDYREPTGPTEPWDHQNAPTTESFSEEPLGISLPVHMI
jgi:hypothetical protein